MFHDRDGMYFERLENGSVRILKTDGMPPDMGGKIEFEHIVTDGPWCSIVLSMSKYGERPNDWYAWMDHHHGKVDLINKC